VTRALLLVLAACAAHPGKNEVVATVGRDTKYKSPITKATFDGNLTVIQLGTRVRLVIASCYAHAQQKIGDHDHFTVALDGKDAKTGELAITDCTTKHVTATLNAKSADGIKLEAAIDTDLVKP
jgi:hypothetical protein